MRTSHIVWAYSGKHGVFLPILCKPSGFLVEIFPLRYFVCGVAGVTQSNFPQLCENPPCGFGIIVSWRSNLPFYSNIIIHDHGFVRAFIEILLYIVLIYTTNVEYQFNQDLLRCIKIFFC
ncbi:hypothetical protein Peur_054686 [Populus x canadensis]